MADSKWKLQFRDDQKEFIIAAMDYIMTRCEKRFINSPSKPFEEFMAHRTYERATEIRDYIQQVTT